MTLGHDPGPLLSHRAMSLIATYEEMYRVPETDRTTYYFGDYGGHFLKYGTAEVVALTAYDKSLNAIQMDDNTFQQAAEFNYRGGIIARMWSCMLGEGAHLQNALDICTDRQNAVLLYEDAPDFPVPMEHLTRLTQSGQEDFTALLGAQVREIRAGESAVEVVVSGVEPQELARLEEAYDAFIGAEQAMRLMV